MESAKTKRNKKGESEFGGSVKGEPTGDESDESDVEEAEVWKVRLRWSILHISDDSLIHRCRYAGHASLDASDPGRHAPHGR